MGPRKSATGNDLSGFTFVEVMVALVVLCGGIVLIYKAFFLCADYLNNLTSRLYASSLLDERIGDITESFADWPAHPLDFGSKSVVLVINHKPIQYNYAINCAPLPDVKSVWRLDVSLSWTDGPRHMQMHRSDYMLR
jgi:prepilin-type N-terminal cleavage/methylation domain-containing protein